MAIWPEFFSFFKNKKKQNKNRCLSKWKWNTWGLYGNEALFCPNFFFFFSHHTELDDFGQRNRQIPTKKQNTFRDDDGTLNTFFFLFIFLLHFVDISTIVYISCLMPIRRCQMHVYHIYTAECRHAHTHTHSSSNNTKTIDFTKSLTLTQHTHTQKGVREKKRGGEKEKRKREKKRRGERRTAACVSVRVSMASEAFFRKRGKKKNNQTCRSARPTPPPRSFF